MISENSDQSIPDDLSPNDEPQTSSISSLRELIDLVSGKTFQTSTEQTDAMISDQQPFPFLGLVGQEEMKLALLLSLINPKLDGVLLIGPRGTGKTTAARSMVNLLPQIPRSLCFYSCLPEDIEQGGIDAVCPDCARKYGQGEALAVMDQVRLVELPLNAKIEDVVGGVDERAMVHQKMRLKRGILAQANRNILYVDEVNLLANEVVDVILDAAAQGYYTVRRGPVSATYRAKFVLIGSMNPEEGRLRPQIMDRFGLRVFVKGLKDPDQRYEAYTRVIAYQNNPWSLVKKYEEETEIARQEIQIARDMLPKVVLPDELAKKGLRLIERLGIDSLRAEINLFEAAKAHAIADGRLEVEDNDIMIVAQMALRLRGSNYIKEYLSQHHEEEEQIRKITMEEL